jgi:hypothetical protein
MWKHAVLRVRRHATDYFRAPGLSAPANDATMFRPTNASFMGGAGLFPSTPCIPAEAWTFHHAHHLCQRKKPNV